MKHAENKRKRMKESINNIIPVKETKKKFLTTIGGIIAIVIIGFIVASNIVLDKNKTTNLVINNNNITSNLKNEVLIENDVIYLSKQDISNFFDNYIYEEEETNQIITTYNKKIAAIGFEENKIIINGSEKNIYAHAIEKDGQIYLPISEMQDVYDVEINNIEKSKVVTIDSLNREQKKAVAAKNLSVKSSTKFLNKTVDKVKKGQTVIVVSENKGYTKIRTEDGKLGYVKSDKLANEVVVREAMEEEKQIDGKVNLTWDYYSKYASAPDRTGESIEGINVVSPSFFYIGDDGTLETNIGKKGESYITWAHNNGYKVWPMISNAEAGLTVTSKIMNSYEARQNLIEDIVNNCVKYKLDGINVDFENMKEEDKDLFSRFIIELTPRLKEMGLVTSVDVTAPDGGETWSMCFDRNVIGDVADYIVFMAYDEYGVSSTTPGTTAGYDWVKLSLNKFLQTEEIEASKIILAVPFYTRVWTTDSQGKVSNNTISMKKVYDEIPDGVETTWDDKLKQNYVEYTSNGNKKQIWIEDEASIKEKISLIKENDLGGVASWRKDLESDNIWSILDEIQN